jgi:hypothetical protein
MEQRQVAAGTAIFRAGDPSEAVFIIQDGEVAITVGDRGAQTEVARLHAGELFGESGVLENRPRSATATAIAPTTLLVTDATTFMQAFGLDNDRALALVKLLCSRLRTTSRRAAAADFITTGSGASPDACAIRLVPLHPQLVAEIGPSPIDVRHLPFQVGNRYGGETLPLASNRSCCIPAHGDPDLAAPHFEILRRTDRIGVRDLGSRYGTIVNGRQVDRTSIDTFVPLRVGDNDVAAGRGTARFHFRIQVGHHASSFQASKGHASAG